MIGILYWKNQEGTYRFWLDASTGSLKMKLNGDKELHTIPKNTKRYDCLMNDMFNKELQEEVK